MLVLLRDLVARREMGSWGPGRREAEKEREREAERKKKEAERAEQHAEKARKEAEKEKERKKREAEREEKRMANEKEKAAKEEKKRQREEEKRRKEEEKQRMEEEKRKKTGSQKTLGSFFNISSAPKQSAARERSPMSPAPSAPALASAGQSPAHPTPNKAKEQSAYEKLFPDFFVQSNVRLAAMNRFGRDSEALEVMEADLDGYLRGIELFEAPSRFDAVALFNYMQEARKPRGKALIPVREIMTRHNGNASRPIDLTTESQTSHIKSTTELLKRIPLKFLKFQEDVRPPYCGTYTSQPVSGIARLARNPLRRDLPNTNYDYDSEAEWVEDEDAEDLNSEGEEEEDLGDEGDDMDGFLDDENDEKPIRRCVPQGDLEPVSSGLCWEDDRGRNDNVQMASYRMEFMLDPQIKSIDPFSSEYWQKPSAKDPKPMDPPRLPLQAMKSNNATPNKPVKIFGLSDSLKSTTSKNSTAPTDDKPKKLLPAQDLESFKREVQGSDLSKIGLIEVLTKKFPGRPKAAIKGTLESVAKRVGSREAEKRWVIIEE
ncbi:hypothetical protein B7463_g10462, partial [Scytalidium lignicola]